MQQDYERYYQSDHVTLTENGSWLVNYTIIT